MGIPRYRRDMTSEWGTLRRRAGDALAAATRAGRGEDDTLATPARAQGADTHARLTALETEVARLRDVVEGNST